MRVKEAHLPVIFTEVQKVRTFLAQYCGGPDKIPVSLDDITVAIAELYSIKIISRLVPLNSKLLRGMIEIYEGEATITIDAELNTQTTRYVFVKEACHVMLVTAENVTTDPAGIIDYYVHARPSNEDDGTHPDEIICEEITKIGAVELLFPPALRDEAKAKIAAGTETLFTIAESLHIPENLVEFALSDWYMDLSKRLSGFSENRERFK